MIDIGSRAKGNFLNFVAGGKCCAKCLILEGFFGGPPRSRTEHQRIMSPLL